MILGGTGPVGYPRRHAPGARGLGRAAGLALPRPSEDGRERVSGPARVTVTPFAAARDEADVTQALEGADVCLTAGAAGVTFVPGRCGPSTLA